MNVLKWIDNQWIPVEIPDSVEPHTILSKTMLAADVKQALRDQSMDIVTIRYQWISKDSRNRGYSGHSLTWSKHNPTLLPLADFFERDWLQGEVEVWYTKA